MIRRHSTPAARSTRSLVLVAFVAAISFAAPNAGSAQTFAAVSQDEASATSGEIPCSSLPPDGSIVKAGDARCGDRGSFVELPASTVSCLQSGTRAQLATLLREGALTQGSSVSAAQADLRLRTRKVTVQQYAWPVWVESASNGTLPYVGCAAGIALPGEVRVSLREGEVRARRVVAWETANSLLSWALDRRDLGDDSKVLEPLVEKVLDGCSALPYVGE